MKFRLKYLAVVLYLIIMPWYIFSEDVNTYFDIIENELYIDPDVDMYDVVRSNEKYNFEQCFYYSGYKNFKQLLDEQRENLELIILEKIKENDYKSHKYIYMAAYYKYNSAIEYILDYFVTCDRFYGWEGADYLHDIRPYLSDTQYQQQILCIIAIEHILGKDIRNMHILSNEQYMKLSLIYQKYLPLKKDKEIIIKWELRESLIAYWKLNRLGYNIELYK